LGYGGGRDRGGGHGRGQAERQQAFHPHRFLQLRRVPMAKKATRPPVSGLPNFSREQPSRLQEQNQAKANQASESQKTDHKAHRRALCHCVTDRASR
jgi:hypothetical protein